MSQNTITDKIAYKSSKKLTYALLHSTEKYYLPKIMRYLHVISYYFFLFKWSLIIGLTIEKAIHRKFQHVTFKGCVKDFAAH